MNDIPERRPLLSGRRVLITGAAGDIGSAFAERAASSGADLVLCDQASRLDRLQGVAERCSELRPNSAIAIECFDVTQEAAVAQAFDNLRSNGQLPDLLFNNAGYQGQFENVATYSADDFRRVLDINVTGVFLVLQSFADQLAQDERSGAIVNMASMAHAGAPNMSAYCASKAAVIGLTKSAALDLAPNIRVNSVSPAFIGPGEMWDRQVAQQASAPSQYYSDDAASVADEMIWQVPLRRFGSLDEVASTVLFLLSDEASYITAFNIEVSGGI